MLTLFMRKDIARARVLADDLNRYGEQLHYTIALGRDRYGERLASPKGLLLCFGAGALVSMVVSRPDGGRSLVNPLLTLAKSNL